MNFDVEIINTKNYITHKPVYINGIKATPKYTNGTRPIYVWESYILKLNDIWFKNQNRVEVKKWPKIDISDREFFQPIIAYDEKYRWIIQEKIDFRQGRKSGAIAIQAHRLFLKYNISDTIDNDDSLICNENFGVRTDGRLVIFDWGL